MKKVFLFGYYGFGNLGDELLCAYYTSLLGAHFPELKLIILRDKPNEQEIEYKTVSRWNLWQLSKMMAPGDLLVGGGGSIFQDATSKRSLFYYLGLLRLAGWRHLEIILAGQGLGPLSSLGRRLVGPYLNSALGISCRDQWSLATLVEMGVNRPLLYLGVDPLWDFQAPELLFKPAKRRYRPSALGFFFRKEERNRKQRLLFRLKLRFEGLRLITLFPEDYPVAEVVSQEIGASPPLLLTEVRDLAAIAPELTMVIGERLHGLLLAAKYGLPGIGLSNDPKIKAFCQQMEWPCFSWQDLCVENLMVMAIEEILSDLGSAEQQVLQKRTEMEKKAREERDWFLQLIEQTLVK